MSGAAEPCPRILISRKGPFYHLAIDPADALPASAMRPSTYASHASAAREAEFVRRATGWPIIDQTLRGHGAAD